LKIPNKTTIPISVYNKTCTTNITKQRKEEEEDEKTNLFVPFLLLLRESCELIQRLIRENHVMEGESWVGVGLLGYEMKAKTRKASDFLEQVCFLLCLFLILKV
jgi:hypothetical protein